MGNIERIRETLDDDEALALSNASAGYITRLAASFDARADNLLGYILQLSYDEATIVTCDAWKLQCGGVPKNSFVLIRCSPLAARLAATEKPRPALILARVTEAVATPLSNETQQTIFAIHKVQAAIDPYTDTELQWGALKAAILGTYYDDEDKIAFGSDIDSYVSPHFYEVYVPAPDDLERLINSFVAEDQTEVIGEVRYTETRTAPVHAPVSVRISPQDFIENRTALFGKTRTGKSNTVKVLADMILRSHENVGQVIVDLNGEYSNVTPQDNTSLYVKHRFRCVRYTARPTVQADNDTPNTLKVNFYQQIALGHTIIHALFEDEFSRPPNYLRPLLEWDPCDEADLQERFQDDWGERQRYIRARSMYFATLAKAGFAYPRDMKVEMVLHKALRVALAADAVVANVARIEDGAQDEIHQVQPLQAAIRIYERLFDLYRRQPNNTALFPANATGDPYFGEIHTCLLKTLGDRDVSGAKYLTPFAQYHDIRGGDIIHQIVAQVDSGKTIIIDLANADETVARFYSELVCKAIFHRQTEKFTGNDFGGHSVLFYFEEAHNLFNRDDRDLRSIYNRLAKEGAKNRIGMVYATQSMTTLSPDLLKNTENFFIAHLNDDREINELTRRFEFADIGLDVQRCKTRGYVRMITLSHRYALPVQIRQFGVD